MKKISVVIPCYNDSKSIALMRERLSRVFAERLPQYDYEIIYVDDCSPDDTWAAIQRVCATDIKCKGIRNVRNFGFYRNVFASMKYGDGDVTFMLFAICRTLPNTYRSL